MSTPGSNIRVDAPETAFILAAALLLCLGLGGCQWTDPPDPGKPVLQIRGTKPPSIDLALRLRYEATTEQRKRQCQKHTMLSGYEAITPAWYVWPHEPPSSMTNRRYRIVPMVKPPNLLPDSLRKKDLEPFRWTVNAGWAGEPVGCDLELTYIYVFIRYRGGREIETYSISDKNKVGSVRIKANVKNCNKNENINENKSDIDCRLSRWEESKKDKINCKLDEKSLSRYCTSKPIKDTISTKIKVSLME